MLFLSSSSSRCLAVLLLWSGLASEHHAAVASRPGLQEYAETSLINKPTQIVIDGFIDDDDLLTCFDNLMAADSDMDARLERDEYAEFISLESNDRINLPFPFLDLSLVAIFYAEACTTCFDETGDSNCCVGDAAHIGIDGQDPERLFSTLVYVCGTVQEQLDRILPPEPTASPAPSTPSSEPPTSVPGETSTPTSAPLPQGTNPPTVAPAPGGMTAPTAAPLPGGTTAFPTVVPTSDETISPTAVPAPDETTAPSVAPSPAGTTAPTSEPTNLPLDESRAPTVSPSASPSLSPSVVPSGAPSSFPSGIPTTFPSALPTGVPSSSPSSSPSDLPSTAPTNSPSSSPSGAPTGSPTENPSSFPSPSPSATPTATPSSYPSAAPTVSPSYFPSGSPTSSPSSLPTTSSPTSSPTVSPSGLPSLPPNTDAPTTLTQAPTTTTAPTDSPTLAPTTGLPNAMPSSAPFANPSAAPTAAPSALPSPLLTGTPTAAPTLGPTDFPTMSPSINPDLVCVSFSYQLNNLEGLTADDIFFGRNNTLRAGLEFAGRNITIQLVNNTFPRTEADLITARQADPVEEVEEEEEEESTSPFGNPRLRKHKQRYSNKNSPATRKLADFQTAMKLGVSSSFGPDEALVIMESSDGILSSRLPALEETRRSLSSPSSRRLVFYTDEYPSRVTNVVENFICENTADDLICVIIQQLACVIREEGDDVGVIRFTLRNGLRDAINSGEFLAVIPPEFLD